MYIYSVSGDLAFVAVIGSVLLPKMLPDEPGARCGAHQFAPLPLQTHCPGLAPCRGALSSAWVLVRICGRRFDMPHQSWCGCSSRTQTPPHRGVFLFGTLDRLDRGNGPTRRRAADPISYYLFWTPPHFWTLSLNRAGDYTRAGIPSLPALSGEAETQRQILIYTLLLVPISFLPWLLGFASALYEGVAVASGAMMVVLALSRTEKRAGRPPIACTLFLSPTWFFCSLRCSLKRCESPECQYSGALLLPCEIPRARQIALANWGRAAPRDNPQVLTTPKRGGN